MRTFALVSLGAAFFTIISIIASEKFSATPYLFEVSRIPSQIVLGVGFIGAGLIIFYHSQLRGLTTAAGLWVAAAIGMAVGFKIYTLAIFTAFLVVSIFIIFWFVENKLVKKLASKPPPDTQEL